MALPDAPPLPTPVELRVCADLSQLPVLRAMAETITVLADFTLDDASDVKLAVDEVCSTLITDASSGAELVCLFHVIDDELHVRVWTETLTGRFPDEQSFGWHVLRTLTETISATHEPLGPRTFRTTVTFTKPSGGDR